MSLEVWLPKLAYEKPKRFPEIVELMNALLPENTQMIRVLDSIAGKKALTFEQDGIALPVTALSDGYRSFICWVADLLYQLSTCCPEDLELSEMPGVVMIDEIDLHLHPEWQRTVLAIISRAFPKLQFIMTTHSPIVAGAHTGRLFLTGKQDGKATIEEGDFSIHGKNADQILLSPYFDLETSRAPGFRDGLIDVLDRLRAGEEGASVDGLQLLIDGRTPRTESGGA